MGAMLTYSSYLRRTESLPGAAATISISDFGVAFFAGLVVFPVMFAFGLSDQIISGEIGEGRALGALFVSLPQAFFSMGAAGRVVGLVFFAALFVGALTSAISLLEVVVSSLIDNWKLSRIGAATGAGLIIMLVGIPSAYSYSILGLFDAVAGEFLLVVGAFALALFVGWKMNDPVAEVRQGFGGEGLLRGWLYMVRVVVPIILVIVIYDRGKNVVQTVVSLISGN
jgi:NSS family neurotransmitter:Na+ symporter